MLFQSINPYTQEILQGYESHSWKQALRILENAQKAAKDWRTTAFEERAALMRNCGELLLKNKQEYALLISLEMGKVIREAVLEVEKCARCCYFYADQSAQFLEDEFVSTEASKSKISYRPLGVILAIMPWNFPFWQVFRFACPTLMAGNIGILKHAPNVPQCALAIEKLFRDAGFPEYCFQNLLLDVKSVKKVIQSDYIQAVTITGSERAGSEVAKVTGKNLKKCVLELGGSDAFIVLEDADIPAVAAKAVEARMRNNGQSCISAKRFIVPKNKSEEFVHEMKKRMESLKRGNPLKPDTDYAVLAREDLAEKLLEQVAVSIKKGANMVLGDKKLQKKGAQFEATILTQVSKKMPAFEEELFGPVASILTYKDVKEAVRLANSTRYGLGASIWTKDAESAEKMASEIQAGSVFVNEIVKSDQRLPFGGIKKSGFGRELSYWGIREFCNVQTVWVK